MIVPPVGYLQRLREICTQHDILLIFDEVITAFGRCGAMTGAEAFGVTPDIMNIAKQVTNGAQPMGAVVVRPEIYHTFMNGGEPDYQLEFPHGYTYSAHPVSCAVALATLDILQREQMVERVQALAPYFERAVHSLQGAKHVADIRNIGLAAGITLAARPGEPAAPLRRGDALLGKRILRALRRRHPAAGAAVHQQRSADRCADQRRGRRPQRHRIRREP